MNRLRELRTKNNISLNKLSMAVGIALSSLSRFDNGKTGLGYDNLKTLSDYFNVSIDYLLGYDNKNNNKIDEHIENASTSTLSESLEIQRIIGKIKHLNNEDLKLIESLVDRLIKQKDRENE